MRLHAAKLGSGDRVEFPLTQADLADATGLTAVHVNRTLQEMRRLGMIELHNRTLGVTDLEVPDGGLGVERRPSRHQH